MRFKFTMDYSINKITNELTNYLVKNKDRLNIEIYDGPLNCKIIDAGIKANGSIEAGLRISEICLGGLGKVDLVPNKNSKTYGWDINVSASKPVLACLGSQYAGWSLNHNNFFSLGSGPARSIAQKEEIFKEIKYIDKSNKTVLILEVDNVPPEEIVNKVSSDCKISPEGLIFILTPTISISGNIQVVSRVLEVAIHKIHELKFPLERIIHGFGTAPLPPLGKNFVQGMGRTNDSIIYGGIVQLYISGPEDEIKRLSSQLPSLNSKDYGKPFKEIFESYSMDFYKIDGTLFSPACVIINSINSGKTYSSGRINEKLLNQSFS